MEAPLRWTRTKPHGARSSPEQLLRVEVRPNRKGNSRTAKFSRYPFYVSKLGVRNGDGVEGLKAIQKGRKMDTGFVATAALHHGALQVLFCAHNAVTFAPIGHDADSLVWTALVERRQHDIHYWILQSGTMFLSRTKAPSRDCRFADANTTTHIRISEESTAPECRRF